MLAEFVRHRLDQRTGRIGDRGAEVGRTRTASAPGNLPMATSKPCAGTLIMGSESHLYDHG